jgi:putative DNA primase/helicase
MLPVRNGLLHLPSGELYPPTPHFFGLNSTDVTFDPPEPAEWLRFLHELWPDGKESIDALQEWFGLCLGVDTRHHKILLLVGPKRAGKGTIERVLQGLLGKDSYAAPSLASLGTNFGTAALIGKPLAIIVTRVSARAPIRPSLPNVYSRSLASMDLPHGPVLRHSPPR